MFLCQKKYWAFCYYSKKLKQNAASFKVVDFANLKIAFIVYIYYFNHIYFDLQDTNVSSKMYILYPGLQIQSFG
jgi:hypothetical protein